MITINAKVYNNNLMRINTGKPFFPGGPAGPCKTRDVFFFFFFALNTCIRIQICYVWHGRTVAHNISVTKQQQRYIVIVINTQRKSVVTVGTDFSAKPSGNSPGFPVKSPVPWAPMIK